MTGNPYIPVKNTLSSSAIVYFVGELFILCETELSVGLYLAKAVHKFHDRLLID